jgi:hypothetical protein
MPKKRSKKRRNAILPPSLFLTLAMLSKFELSNDLEGMSQQTRREREKELIVRGHSCTEGGRKKENGPKKIKKGKRRKENKFNHLANASFQSEKRRSGDGVSHQISSFLCPSHFVSFFFFSLFVRFVSFLFLSALL